MTLSAIAAFIWLGWIAKQTGWPTQLARNAFKLAPGFKPEFNFISFLVALAVTISWGWLLHWRLSRRPSVLWRAVVLSSGGVILCWLLLMTLWLPWLNYNKSYALVAGQIATHLPMQYDCVNTEGVGPSQRASFAFLGPVKFAQPDQADCAFLLVQDDNVRKPGRAGLAYPDRSACRHCQRRHRHHDDGALLRHRPGCAGSGSVDLHQHFRRLVWHVAGFVAFHRPAVWRAQTGGYRL
jgi:hypothetical protein